jgi:predicted esterase
MGCSSSKANAVEEPVTGQRAVKQEAGGGTNFLHEAVIIQPTRAHTHTVIMLHGLDGHGQNFSSNPWWKDDPWLSKSSTDLPKLVHGLCPDKAGGIKYIFPTAPERGQYFKGPDGPAIRTNPPSPRFTNRGWYTYFTDFDGQAFSDDDVISRDEFYATVKQLVDLFQQEAEALGPCGGCKVIIGGYSQGGTIAASAAIQLDPVFRKQHGTPKALIAIDTLPMAFAQVNLNLHELMPTSQVPDGVPEVTDFNAKIPVFHFVGSEDTIYPVTNQHKAWARFTEAGYTVTPHEEKGVTHEEALQKGGLAYTAAWITQLFFQ